MGRWTQHKIGNVNSQTSSSNKRLSEVKFSHNVLQPNMQSYAIVHGDGFAIAGLTGQIAWVHGLLEQHCERKRKHFGPLSAQERSIRVHNRVLIWVAQWIRYEVDQRQLIV